MKKIIIMMLVVAMLFSVVSCTQEEEPEEQGSKDSKETKEGDDKEPITFTMFAGDTNSNADNFESPVAKEIEKQTGVKLDIEYVASEDALQQKLSFFAASGEYPDLMFGKNELNIIKDAKGIIKLDDLIDKHGENIKKHYGNELNRLKWSEEDPSIYYVGGAEYNDSPLQPGTAFLLQHAVVKDLGFPQIKTVKDFENAIRDYKAKNPKIDGKPTIGLSLLAEDWRFLISVSNPACFATGGPDDGEWFIDQDTLKAQRHLTRPEEKEYFKWLNHMNSEGLLDPESFVQKTDQYTAKIASGRVLGLTDARWSIDQGVRTLKEDKKFERTYGYYPAVLKDGIKDHTFQFPGYIAQKGIAITTSCKDPDRAMKFLDWMASEESIILRSWGVQGTHYDIVGGKRVEKEEYRAMRLGDEKYKQKTGIENYLYPFPSYGIGMMDSTGQPYRLGGDKETIMADYSDIEKEVLKAYNAEIWKDLYPSKDEFKVKPYGAAWIHTIDNKDIKAKEEKILKLGYKMIPAAIMAKPSEFDAKYDAYLKAIEDAGLKEVTEAFEQVVKSKVELWK